MHYKTKQQPQALQDDIRVIKYSVAVIALLLCCWTFVALAK